MPGRQDDKPETYHLTCPICTALPGTSCIGEDYQELPRVHPSRKLSVAERNRRHAEGWEPPELAERHRRQREATRARAPLFNPRLGPGVGAALAGRRPPGAPAPRGGPWGTRERDRPASLPPATARAPQADASADGPDMRSWLAAYLGGLPGHTAIPRQQLRDAVSRRWPDGAATTIPPTPARQLRQHLAGRSGGTSSKGRRSSQKLAAYLRSFEELGLIQRDGTRDTVIITDPGGLHALADAASPPGEDADHTTSEAAGRAG